MSACNFKSQDVSSSANKQSPTSSTGWHDLLLHEVFFFNGHDPHFAHQSCSIYRIWQVPIHRSNARTDMVVDGATSSQGRRVARWRRFMKDNHAFVTFVPFHRLLHMHVEEYSPRPYHGSPHTPINPVTTHHPSLMEERPRTEISRSPMKSRRRTAPPKAADPDLPSRR